MIWLVIALAFPWIACYLAVRLIRPLYEESTFFSVSLSLALAMGTASCSFFALTAMTLSDGSWVMGAEMFVLAQLVPILFIAFRKQGPQPRAVFQKPPRMLAACFIAVLVLIIIGFIFESIDHPVGHFDTLAMWNLKARFIVRGGEQWTDMFYPRFPELSSPDYPLLLPATVARFWTYFGSETVAMPMVAGFIFTFGTAALLVSSLIILRTTSIALLAGMVLLGSTKFIKFGCVQIADIPVGFFVLAAMVLIAFKDSGKGRAGPCLFLAGTMAALAAWTKNEGLMFMVALALGRLIAVVPGGGWKEYLREMGRFVSGALAVMAVVIWFKMAYAPPNDLVAAQNSGETWAKLTDFSQWIYVVKEFLVSFYRMVRFWIALLPVYILIMGWTFGPGAKASVKTIVAMALILLGGYTLAYVTSPYEIGYHTRTSQDRLLLHIIPTLFFAFFLIAPAPDRGRPEVSEKPSP